MGRKSHTKSRNGCGQCKRRRIKCDERPPCCGNCLKRNQQCDYELLEYLGSIPPRLAEAQPKSAAQSCRASTTIGRARKSSQECQGPSPPSGRDPIAADMQLNMSQLQLMYHYMTETCRTFSDTFENRHIWQSTVPEAAMAHDFLMHAILAVSALHKAHLCGGLDDSTNAYLTLARAHHERGLGLFHSRATEIVLSNRMAAVAFSVLTLIFSCGLMEMSGATKESDVIDSLITILNTSRRYWMLFRSLNLHTEEESLGGLSLRRPRFLTSSMRDSALEAIRLISLLNSESSDVAHDKSIYHAAIIQFEDSLQIGEVLPLVWSSSVSSEFLVLLEKKRPMALIVLAHGCAFAKYKANFWFMSTWTAKLVKSIASLVDTAWWPGLKWPLEQFG